MRWFRRSRRRQEDLPGLTAVPRTVLPPLSDDQAVRFAAAARQTFAEAGVETVFSNGALQALDGRVLGLTGLAHAAADLPERQWNELLAHHVGVMAAAEAEPLPTDLDSVRHQLYLRIFSRDDLPGDPLDGESRDVVGDLVAVPALDYPEHVASLTDRETIDALGGWDAIAQVALSNLGGLASDQTSVVAGDDGAGVIHLSIGGFFNASRLLVLDAVLARDFGIERPTHGVLVAVPNRYLLAVHPVTGTDCLQAMQTLVQLAHAESDAPGGLPPEVYFWRGGEMEQVTRHTGGGTTTVDATGMLGQAMTELGLLDE